MKADCGKSEKQCVDDFVSARGYGDLRVAVAEVVIEALTPIRERYTELMQDPPQASERAEPKVLQIKGRMGFLAAGKR